MSQKKDFVKEALEESAKHVALNESKVPKKMRSELVALMRDKLELDEREKEIKALKEVVQAGIMEIMQEAGEEAVMEEGVGKVTVVKVKGREKFEWPKLIKGLLKRGVKEEVINASVAEAVSYGEPSEYVKVTGER